MKNFKKTLASAIASAMMIIGANMFAIAPSVSAIPYTPDTTGLTQPGFNVFTGVPGYGDESDFMRGRVSGSSNPFTDPVNDACANGTQYSIQMYVHNGANQSLNNNGTGPAIAHNTTVKVAVPASTANNLTGTISASNAPSVSDTLKINCNGKTMQLSFVQNSAIEQHMDGSTSPLSNSIVTTGAPIDSKGKSGDVWGCFDERVLVYLKVEVKEVPTPPASGVCKATDMVVDKDKRTVRVTVSGETTNGATIVAYKIDFGDGTTVNTQTASHTYKGEGPYTIIGSVQVKYPDGHTEWKTANSCQQVVSFKPGTPPVTPPTPTVLPNTGAGSVMGIFAGVTVAGALFHRYILGRKNG